MNTQQKKPQLHQSHLQMLYRCGHKFERVVLKGDKEPQTTPLVVGKSTHYSVATNLTNKMERGSLLPREAVKDLSRDDFLKTWDESQIVLSEEEKFAGLAKTKGELQDQTIQLVSEHHYVIAPEIKPIAIERKWVLETKDKDGNDTLPFDIAGMIDVEEEEGFRDIKTRKTNLGQSEVDTSEQYTTYAMAKYFLDGKLPLYIAQDTLIKPTKTRDAKAISYYTTRTKDDFVVLFKRYAQAAKIIKSGMFLPANSNDYLCSKDFCGFYSDGSCPYVNSKRLVDKPRQIKPKKVDEENNIVEKLMETLKNE